MNGLNRSTTSRLNFDNLNEDDIKEKFYCALFQYSAILKNIISMMLISIFCEYERDIRCELLDNDVMEQCSDFNSSDLH